MNRILMYSEDGLVAERVRRIAGAERCSVAVADELELFREIAAKVGFDGYLVDLVEPARVGSLGPLPRPVVVLAPLADGPASAPIRLTLPDAIVIDRALRDPELLRQVFRPQLSVHSETAPDPVRSAFEPFGLTDRQLEVLARALLGESGAVIARRLFISELTVRNHLHSIYDRVGVSGRRELLGRFVQGLIGANA